MNRMEKMGMTMMVGWLLIMSTCIGGAIIYMALSATFMGPPPFLFAVLGAGFIIVPVGGLLLTYGQHRRFNREHRK